MPPNRLIRRSDRPVEIIGAAPTPVGEIISISVADDAEWVTIVAPSGRTYTVAATGNTVRVPLNEAGSWSYLWSTGESGTWDVEQPQPRALELIDESAADAPPVHPTPTMPLSSQRPQ